MTMPDPPDDATALESILRWYEAMGVDALVDEMPHDRFIPVDAASTAAVLGHAATRGASTAEPATRGESNRVAPPAMRKAMDATPVAADALVRQAEVLAREATNLEELKARWETLPGCGLAATASRIIFSSGTPGAPVLLAGGAPDADDERAGEAFAGSHGRLLDSMLRAIGLDRGSVYLINVVPWRPPGNRLPTPLELALCLPFARRHVALADPNLILCLGERAAQPLLATRDPISRLRGRWMSFEGETKTVKTLVTFSPTILLKQPIQKRRAWADLLMLAAEWDAHRPSGNVAGSGQEAGRDDHGSDRDGC